MNLFKSIGVRGSGADAEERRKRAETMKAQQQQLDSMMPNGAFEPFMSAQEIRMAACVDPDSKLLKMVHDTIRRRHYAVLVELYMWQPGQPTDALVDAAARVKELVDLDKSLEEVVREATKEIREG